MNYNILNQLYTHKRTRSSHASKESRTDFQRDYDRIIFSSAFRRLQNKTQVFPLPGSVFVHNRLTHSLEVASVGRTLGYEIGNYIADQFTETLSDDASYFYRHNLQTVIATACLCHDIGNPAFGHSGEDAIAVFFVKNQSELRSKYTEKQWLDLVNFEGNANATRILTHGQNGKLDGGIDLTMTTLLSISKYPCESIAKDKSFTHRKKFGFFQEEKDTFLQSAKECNMIMESSDPIIFKRHPFVWLTEAADDICYNIIDLEDAHRLGILPIEQIEPILVNLIDTLGKRHGDWKKNLDKIMDENERIGYLRAMSIGSLIQHSIRYYKENLDTILQGNHTEGLYDMILNTSEDLQMIKDVSIQKIYNNKSVVQIENAGYNVMYELLTHFLLPVLKDKLDSSDRMAIKLLPLQFQYHEGNPYQKTLGVIDFITGMTDNYATDLYRKIKGIDIGMSF